jgi:hypothetical protein
MALRFIDSFGHYGANDLYGLGNGQKWTGYNTSSGNPAVYPTVVTGAGRFGSCFRAFNVSVGGNSIANIYKVLDNQSTWILGFAFKFGLYPSTNASICVIIDSFTQQCDLRVNANGSLSVTRNGTALTNGTSTNLLLTNVWNYIEWYCTISSSISANQCNVNVNGTQWLSVSSGQNTKNTANSTANQFCIGTGTNFGMSAGLSGTVCNYDFCDFYACDGTGSAPYNTFLGDCKVECRWPSGPSGTNTNWVANGGSTTGCINDLTPNGDINYLSSSTTNDVSTFTVPPLGSTPSTIYGLQVIHASRKTDAGIRQISDIVRSGSTNYVGNTVNLSNGYLMFPNIYITDPNTSAAWTQSGANAVEIGVKEIT